tara:strand:+ start:480 stop:917 length:438 start_codon:yes stop_codon:yes gene_type:complete
MTWFDVVKRKKRGKPKDRPPDIMAGEKMPEAKRVAGIKESGRAPKGNTRAIGRGIDLPKKTIRRAGKKLVREVNTRAGSGRAEEGDVRVGNPTFGSRKSRKRNTRNMPKNKCGWCTKTKSRRFMTVSESGVPICLECAKKKAGNK